MAVLDFADIVAGVGDVVHSGSDPVAVAVGYDFLSTKRVWGFGRIRTS